jgi:3-hydroxyacyl-CoA dehydrogenase
MYWKLASPVLAMAGNSSAHTSGGAFLRLLSTCSRRQAPLKVDNLLIIGSGLMGSGVAQSCAHSAKFDTIVLQDVSDKALDTARARMVQNLSRLKKKDATVNEEQIMSRITFSTRIEPKADNNLLVLEAIPEKLELKQKLFKSLSDSFGKNDGVILASNTSSLSCRDIARDVENKARFAGLHFFNPVPLMKLVEVVRLKEGTDDQTFQALVQFVKDMGKVPVECKDTPGFIVNRLLVPYLFEAVSMLERGDATARDIDTAMKLGAGYPMGPLELADYIGLDTCKFIADTFMDSEGNRICRESPLINELVAKGRLGKKSGKGFYDYSK